MSNNNQVQPSPTSSWVPPPLFETDQPASATIEQNMSAVGSAVSTVAPVVTKPASASVSRTSSTQRLTARSAPTEELFVLVLGQGGIGKTAFINTVSNSTLRISSSTVVNGEKLELSLPFYVDGKCFRLIDTPAFGDSTKSDTDVLTAVASYLATEYTNHKKLSGCIYLHSIAGTRLRGPSRRNLSMFTKLCGKQALANVAIVTTRWDEIEPAAGEARLVELQSKPTLLKPLLELGATLFRYNRAVDAIPTAQDIVRFFINRPLTPLLIQQEMVDDSQTIAETTAGRALQKEYRAQLEDYQKTMQDLRTEYDELKNENRTATAKKVKSEMISVKDAAEKLKEESKRLSGARATIIPSQPLRLIISPTAGNGGPPSTAPVAQSTPRPRRRSSASPLRFSAGNGLPPMPQNPPSALRTPRYTLIDKGKGREVDAIPVVPVQPVPVVPLEAYAPVTAVRTRKRSTRRESTPHRSRSRRRREEPEDAGEIVLNLEGWEDFRYALVGVVILLILVPFIKRYQAIMAY
ncbi:hypothetical protein BKA70DRAFT_1266135 [Coprinopsis sp. MPI-PUGE-AT-0042]|nr:hypothetical protein BKA70DRAFT_1266135 [Coprinopsis sp. MPI-PUGE-AT-0042]